VIVFACFITFLLLGFGDDCDHEIWPDIPCQSARLWFNSYASLIITLTVWKYHSSAALFVTGTFCSSF